MDIFLTASSVISLVAIAPLLLLAWRSVRDAKEIREIHHDLAGLVMEAKELGEIVHHLQHEIRSDQQEAKSEIEDTRRAVEQVSSAVEQVGTAVVQMSEAVGVREAA